MARNWASFLNEASRGYGLGFDRYQQYDQAREGREQRALVRGISDDLQTANADVTTKREAVPMGTYGPGQSVDQVRQERAAVPTGPGMAQPAPQARAVEPQAPAAPPAPTHSAAPIRNPDMGQNAADYVNDRLAGGKGDVPQSPVPDVPFGIRAPAAEAEPESALPVPPPPTNKKAVAKHQADTAVDILQEIEPANIRKVMKGGEKIKVEGGRSRMDAFDAAKNKMRDLLARQGDVEGLLSLDAKFEAMQHDRMMGGLRKAMHLMAVDPQAAAEELAKAYSYLPDGTEMDIKVAPDGTLVGRGYDDVTGEFKETMQIDSEMLSQIYRYYEDPAQFHSDMADLRVTNEQLAYDRGRDTVEDRFKLWDQQAKQVELMLEGQKVEIDAYNAESQAGLRNAQGAYYGAAAEVKGMEAVGAFLALQGASGASSKWSKASDIKAVLGGVESFVKDMRTGAMTVPASVQFTLGGRSPINSAAVTEVMASLMLHAGPGSMTNPEAARIAGDLALMEISESGMGTKEVTGDREYKALREEFEKNVDLQLLGYENDAAVISHNSKLYYVNLGSLPALSMQVRSIQGLRHRIAQGDPAAQQELQELLQGPPPPEETEALPLDLNAPGVPAGQAVRRAAEPVIDAVGGYVSAVAPYTPPALLYRGAEQALPAVAGFARGVAAPPTEQ